MPDRETIEQIHSCFEHADWAEGISLCADLATDDPETAANVFAAYRPSIIEITFAWAREVNSHIGVFLPASLDSSDVPESYELMRAFETERAVEIDAQAQRLPQVKEHVACAKEMDPLREEIETALRNWRKDQDRRHLCRTNDREKLRKFENSALDIATEEVKLRWKRQGRKLKDLKGKKLTDIVIDAVKQNDEFLEEAMRREQARTRAFSDHSGS